MRASSLHPQGMGSIFMDAAQRCSLSNTPTRQRSRGQGIPTPCSVPWTQSIQDVPQVVHTKNVGNTGACTSFPPVTAPAQCRQSPGLFAPSVAGPAVATETRAGQSTSRRPTPAPTAHARTSSPDHRRNTRTEAHPLSGASSTSGLNRRSNCTYRIYREE